MYNQLVKRVIKTLTLLVGIFFLSGCGNLPQESIIPTQPLMIQPTSPTLTQEMTPPVSPTMTTVPITNIQPVRVWINPIISNQIKSIFSFPEGVELVSDFHSADYQIDLSDVDFAQEYDIVYYYVVSVPFMDLTNEISFDELQTYWQGHQSDLFKIWINENDLLLLETIFGQLKNTDVLISEIEPNECLLDTPCYRIQRFEDVSPRWRIVSVDGLSILDRTTAIREYPLKATIVVKNKDDRVESDSWFLDYSNFNPEKLTILALTGTTALTRGTAYQMEQNGVAFPLKHIGDVFQKADIVHISHEVPMFELCPAAVPLREEMRFCSSPKNIELFKMAEVDIVELTGNHLMDWGPEAFSETLALYAKHGIKIYGAGETPIQADAVLKIQDHGNQFAFIGCNVSGPENSWVTNQRPGVLRCDLDAIQNKVKMVRNEGIIPIVTFQHYELDGFSPNPQLQRDFWNTAQSGAVIVSGSQAHFPLGFDFVGDSFIDYGLGNLFFDQMQTWYRKATIDIHYFYEGEYINTELVSIINEDQGQPRLMNDTETRLFLNKMFEHSFYYENP